MSKFKVLSFDGGGIRGLFTAVVINELENRLGESINKHFDLVAGTSTGSLLACGIATGIPTRDIIDLYLDYGKTIFPTDFKTKFSNFARNFSQGISKPKHSDKGLEKVLKKVFKEKKLESAKIKTLVTAYNVLDREAVIFKSYDTQHKKLFIADICKASSSAPTYFPAHVMKIGRSKVPLVDGGVVANNPTACAISEVLALNKKEKLGLIPTDIVVASFGTGDTTRGISIEDAKEWGAIEWAVPIIDVLFDGAADATSYISEQIVGESNYFRFQTKLDAAYDDMDNADQTNLNALIAKAESFLKNERGDRLIDKLVKKLN